MTDGKNLARLKERLNKLQSLVKETERKADTRRKILVGIALLKAVETKAIKPEYLTQLLDKFTTSKGDREFLGLAPLPEQQPAKTQAVTAPNNQAQEHHNNSNY